MRSAAMLALALSLAACSKGPDPKPAQRPGGIAEDRFRGRTMLSDLGRPFPATTAPATGDLSGGVTPPPLTATQLRRQHELTPLIDAISLGENFDPALVHALVSQESRYNPSAVSPKGAAGLMQFMPGTAVTYGLTPAERFDPAKSIRAGIRYLKKLSRMFGGNIDLMLAGYNAGEGAVLKHGRKIPPFRETQIYVRYVKGYYARYRERARQRQTRSLLADANDRRLRLRAPAGGGGPERDPSRERATGSEY